MTRPVSTATDLRQPLQSAGLVLVLTGFPLVAGISASVDLLSTPISIAMRAMTALVCVILFLVSVRQVRPGLWAAMVGATVLFWVAYLLRMFHDTVYASYALISEPSTYWIWAIGGSLIPLAGLIRAYLPPAAAPQHFQWCLWFTALAALIALPNLTTVVVSDLGQYDQGRAALGALNPISLGHLGVQLVLLSLWALVLNPRPLNAFWRVGCVLGAVLGLYLAIASNSRGPLVCLAAAILFAIAASQLKGRLLLAAGLFIGAATFAPMLVIVDQLAGTGVYARLLGQSQLDDVNTQARFDLYGSAWQAFTRSPVTGLGLEDPAFGGYPHNFIIEAFMATGVIGGLAMIAITILALLGAFRVMRDVPGYGWLALLTVQQILAHQFSGSISQGVVVWALIGATLAVLSSHVTVLSRQRRQISLPKHGRLSPSV